jgi:hypothetical protein
LIEVLEVIGAGIVRALTAIRAALIIGAAALLQMSIAAANESQIVADPLKTFFVVIAMAFGSGAFLTVLIFVVDQGRTVVTRRSPSLAVTPARRRPTRSP